MARALISAIYPREPRFRWQYDLRTSEDSCGGFLQRVASNISRILPESCHAVRSRKCALFDRRTPSFGRISQSSGRPCLRGVSPCKVLTTFSSIWRISPISLRLADCSEFGAGIHLSTGSPHVNRPRSRSREVSHRSATLTARVPLAIAVHAPSTN